MDLILHNTWSRKPEVFLPADAARVTMYVCGPTVYNYPHIGNARPYVVFGILARLLRRRWPQVTYARNLTDVDDKINAQATALGVPISAITDRYTAAFHDDMAALGVEPPDIEPRATESIAGIIAMIEKLIASGHAYAAEGHALFSVESYAEYGKLSGRSTDELIAGARVEIAPYKRNAGDFVLWKPSTPDLPGWDSPWGRGRPGWHIECSAMSEMHLGETIDIHAGGVDLVFPHHENEVAQSVCAHGGKPFARFWLHNGFVTVEGRKMSKSIGNVLLMNDLRRKAPGEALRYLLMSAHYRQPLDWSESALQQAIKTLDRLYATLRELEHIVVSPGEYVLPETIEAALHDDLNTPTALAALAQIAGDARRAQTDAERKARKAELLGAGALLGLLQQTPAAWQASLAGDAANSIDAAEVDALLAQRTAAKKARNFAEADAIRDRLTAMGVAIDDTPQGPRWRLAIASEA